VPSKDAFCLDHILIDVVWLLQNPNPSNHDDNNDDDNGLALMISLPIVAVVLIAGGVLACWYTNKKQ
jgi:hypothetical protein